MPAFKSYSQDTNTLSALAATAVVTVPRPTGVVDGDFLLALVCVADGAADTVTPPAGWSLIRRTDAGSSVSLATYYKQAQGEPSAGWSWVFQTAQKHTAAVYAYTGVDMFASVDADATQVNSTTTATVPAVSSSISGTIAVVAACAAAGSIPAPTGYVQRSSQSTSTVTLALSDANVGTAGAIASTTVTTGAAPSIQHVVILRPAVGQYTAEQVRQAFKTAFPPGAELLYDWDNTDADLYSLTAAIATILKRFGYDYVDLARQEFSPLTTVVKLSDWEAAFQITQNQSTSSNSWTSTRQASLLAKLREQGGSTIDNVRGAVEPWLGYKAGDLGTSIGIECNRVQLQILHTYPTPPVPTLLNAGFASAATGIGVSDDGVVSIGGVQLKVTITCANAELIKIQLVGPDSTTVTWDNTLAGNIYFGTGSVTNKAVSLGDAVSFPGKTIKGLWSFILFSSGGTQNVNYTFQLFVEGAGLDSRNISGLGTAIYDWGIYADPAKVNNPDYVGAYRAIQHIAPAHTRPHIFRTLNAIPGSSQVTYPGMCFPSGKSGPFSSTSAAAVPTQHAYSVRNLRGARAAIAGSYCAFKLT